MWSRGSSIKGLSYRIALISTTFFLVNSFKQRLVPRLFPHAVDHEQPRSLTPQPAVHGDLAEGVLVA